MNGPELILLQIADCIVTPLEAMDPKSDRPVEHQRVIALLKEAQAPPADSETPDLPDELLDRLRGQYGRKPQRVIMEEKPGVWAWLCDWLIAPKLAFATAVVLVVGVAAIMLQPPKQEAELLRGNQPQQTAAPAYWLQSEKAEPAPTGLGLPKFIVIPAGEALPSIRDALIFDPAQREARAVRNAKISATIPVADPTDNDEWLSAHRQLSKLRAP